MLAIRTSTCSILSSIASTAGTLTNQLSQISNLTYSLAVSFTFQQPKFHPPFEMVQTAFTALGKHFLVKTAWGIPELNDVIAALNNGTCGTDTNTTALLSSQYTKLVEWYDDSHEELADFYRAVADMPQEEVENCTKALLQTAVDLYNGPSEGSAYNPLLIDILLGIALGSVGCLTIAIGVKFCLLYRARLQGYAPVPPGPAGFVGDDMIVAPVPAPAVVVAGAPTPATAPITTAPAPSAQHESSSDSELGSDASDDSCNNNSNNNRSSTATNWARFSTNHTQANDGHDSDSDLDLDEYNDIEQPSVKRT